MRQYSISHAGKIIHQLGVIFAGFWITLNLINFFSLEPKDTYGEGIIKNQLPYLKELKD